MLEASRTLAVWAVDLLVHYVIDPEAEFGEKLSWWSLLQLFGFLLLILGQVVYSDLLKIPGLYYPPPPPVGTPLPYMSPSTLVSMSPILIVPPAEVPLKEQGDYEMLVE